MNQPGTPAFTAELMKRYNLRPNKALGQNFLIDPNILEKISQVAEIGEADGVLEVGPGLGALTDKLLQQAAKVVAVEIDDRLYPILQDLFSSEAKLQLIHGDALAVDWPQLLEENFTPQQRAGLKVVANIPYSITSPLVGKVLQEIKPAAAVLMVQQEVAQRMASSPGVKEYGSFSVFCQYYCQVNLLFKVGGGVFIPRPEVDSAVVQMLPRPDLPLLATEEKAFFKMVGSIFTVRRKTLLNGLLLLPILAGDRARAAGIIEGLGWAAKVRGETLSVADFVRLYRYIYPLPGEAE